MASSSPRKSGSAYPPYDGTTVRQSDMRKRIKMDLHDDLMQCAPKTFLTTFASNQRLRKIARTVTKSLKSQGVLDEDGWIPLRAEETKEMTETKEKNSRNENQTFAFLGKVAKAIISAVDDYDSTLKPQAEAQPSPYATTCHAKPGYRSFPDWRAVVSSSIHVDPKPSRRPRKPMHVSDQVDTFDLAAIGEFKLKDTSADICDVRLLFLAATYCLDQMEQNEEKLVGAANQLLWNDPCRERVLGFSIENRRTRFWDFSRCGITVSEPFNLDKVNNLARLELMYIVAHLILETKTPYPLPSLYHLR